MGMDLPDGISAQTTLGEFAARVSGQPAPTPWEAPRAIGPGPDVDERDEGGQEMVVDLADEVWLHEDIEDELRARRLPYLAVAATAAAGYGAWGCTALADAISGERAATATATITWVVTVGAVLILWVVRRDRVPDGWSQRWWLAAMAATVWVGVAAVNGASSLPMTAALVLGAVLLSARWAAEHEVPNPSQIITEEPVPVGVPAPPQRPRAKAIENEFARRIEHAWETRVAAGDTAKARDSQLTNPATLNNGVRWEVKLDPGRGVGASTLVGFAPDLALALEVGITDLIQEVGARETQGYITVIERDALAVTPTYRGPEYRDGIVPIGLQADGDREAELVAWLRGYGACNGCVTGDMGSGKTALLEVGALGLRKSGIFRVWWGDGDPEGSSSNLMMRPGMAHWAAAGPGGLLKQLTAFEALLDNRAKVKHVLTEHPVTGLPLPRTDDDEMELREFAPSRAYPSYVWFMPEFFTICQSQVLKDAGFVARFELALRRARKFGLGAFVDTQSALGGDFGNSPTLRAFLNKDNAIFMRTSNPGEQYSVEGMNVSPGLLPRGGGFGLIAGRGRVAPMRTYWQPNLQVWLPTLPPCEEDPDAALAIAPHLPAADAGAGVTLAQRLVEVEEWRAKARAGELAEPAAIEVPVVGVGGIAVPGPMVGKLLQFPAKPAELPAAPVTPEVDLSPKAALVLETLRSRPGPWRSAELAAETGLSASAVSTALTQVLVPAGLVRRPGDVQGIYEAVPVAIQKIPS